MAVMPKSTSPDLVGGEGGRERSDAAAGRHGTGQRAQAEGSSGDQCHVILPVIVPLFPALARPSRLSPFGRQNEIMPVSGLDKIRRRGRFALENGLTQAACDCGSRKNAAFSA
ncbi:MAG: hypothetical protein P8Y71_07580 [Pseudolabrys sp.]